MIRWRGVPLTFVALCAAACTTTSGQPAPADDYASRLAAECTATSAALAQVVEPPEASVAAFGSEVAAIVAEEAERLRQLDPPDELDDAHRRFVLNADDRAAAWRALADEAGDTLDEATGAIASLGLQRDDLADELGVAVCRADG